MDDHDIYIYIHIQGIGTKKVDRSIDIALSSPFKQVCFLSRKCLHTEPKRGDNGGPPKKGPFLLTGVYMYTQPGKGGGELLL